MKEEGEAVYGYTGEVVLICLTVLFAVLFLLMLVMIGWVPTVMSI